MPDTARYEYAVVPATESLSTYAEAGWRLVETLEENGTTVELVFERPVSV